MIPMLIRGFHIRGSGDCINWVSLGKETTVRGAHRKLWEDTQGWSNYPTVRLALLVIGVLEQLLERRLSPILYRL